MQAGKIVGARAGSSVVTGPNASLFAATLAQNAALNGRIALDEAVGAGRAADCLIRAIRIVSVDNLAWEIWFWHNKLFQTPTPTSPAERFAGKYAFTANQGTQIAGAGNFYYYVDGLRIPYVDDDGHTDVNANLANAGQVPSFLNVSIINRSAGAKTANGWFDIQVDLEDTLGW